MGTNYYLMTGKKRKEVCNLGHEHLIDEEYHIGKSSYGRYFTLHSMSLEDGRRLNSLEAWKSFYNECKEKYGDKCCIKNEYGDTVIPEEMWSIIKREFDRELPKDWTPDMIGKPVNMLGLFPNTSGHEGDIWGEKGYVYSEGRELGKDGLYVLLTGDFS